MGVAMSLSDTSQRIALVPPPPAFDASESEELARMFTWLARTELMFADRVKARFGERGQEIARESHGVASVAKEQASKLRSERARR